MKKQIIVLLLAVPFLLQAQEVLKTPFIAPFDFPLSLSGNFGELRSNHFHGGIDFKTQGVTGKPVRCIADGYISRVSISSGGYGNALYVAHTNGYTSVYGHLDRFMPTIAAYIENCQYEKESFSVDVTLDSLQFPIKQGQLIAWSGNTGSSMGPHLHMEIRQTDTNAPIDPLQFYMHKVKDTAPPRAQSIMLYPQPGKGMVNQSSRKQAFSFSAPIEAWGEIGLGIKAFDYMDGTSNYYGVQSITLFVDSTLLFNSTVNGYSLDENRFLNAWTDFEEYKLGRGWIMKSFLVPGNSLKMLHADANRGIVTINQERNYRFKYVLKDLYGNSKAYQFVVRGKKQTIPTYRSDAKHKLQWNRANVVQEPGMELIVPPGMLYENVSLKSRVYADSLSFSFDYQLHDLPLPLHSYCDFMIGVRNVDQVDTSKLYMAKKVGKGKQFIGGRYENGWIKTRIRELGTYTVAIDTVPPKVEPINEATWKRTGKVNIKISDRETGVKSYRGTINGVFILFSFDAKSGRLQADLNGKRVPKATQQILELVVTDQCENSTVWRKEL